MKTKIWKVKKEQLQDLLRNQKKRGNKVERRMRRRKEVEVRLGTMDIEIMSPIIIIHVGSLII